MQEVSGSIPLGSTKFLRKNLLNPTCLSNTARDPLFAFPMFMGDYMRDDMAAAVAAQGDDDRIRAILEQVCQMTGMGFAAVARVTEDRWIACQVLDRIEFGMDPGGELEIKKTLCDDIRRGGEGIYIDHVAMDQAWRTHHVPIFYGFQSYASLPVVLPDGSFYGTLCAIDPNPRSVSAPAIIAVMQDYARSIGAILSAK